MKLSAIRKNRQLTCAEAAKLLGIHESSYWRIEAGKNPPAPSTAKLLQVWSEVEGYALLQRLTKGTKR